MGGTVTPPNRYGAIVGWEGAAEVMNGFVVSITVTVGGAGYTDAPDVTLTSASGSGAQVTALVTNGAAAVTGRIKTGQGRALQIRPERGGDFMRVSANRRHGFLTAFQFWPSAHPAVDSGGRARDGDGLSSPKLASLIPR